MQGGNLATLLLSRAREMHSAGYRVAAYCEVWQRAKGVTSNGRPRRVKLDIVEPIARSFAVAARQDDQACSGRRSLIDKSARENPADSIHP